MNKLFLIAIALFIGLALLIDNSLVKPSARQVASTHDSSPPSSSKNIDLSGLSDEEFARAFKYQLMTTSRVVQNNEFSGVTLGNFYIQGSDNQKNFVCSKYTNLEFTFEADGIAVSGNIPQMKVQGPCLTGGDYTYIESLQIPFKKILASPVQQKDFVEPIPESNEQIAIHFQDVVEQWPHHWNLVGIKLYAPNSNETLSMNGYEIIAILGAPLSLEWNP